MNTNDRPIIFLAFANDYEGGYGYLPELASERRNLQAVLDRAQQEGLCEVVLRSDATLDDLVGVFQDARYRGRIAIFHFGGHAGAYELLLQSADGKHAAAYADGLAAFLGHQPNLQLVFLNGCSTQAHVAGLHAAGIPAVIATHAEIDDQLAGDFALRFYQGLATGATIESAYHTAEAASKAATTDINEMIEAGHLPWELKERPGAEPVLRWSLPEAAGDPLFGLPPLPPGDLPDKPFRNILWFRREDAPLFFGRGYAIRELYQRVTAPGAAPIVLYYGQSGVGKSSLLAAGLLPRLEQVHTVVYSRRDQALRLAGTLAARLPGADLSGSPGITGTVNGAELLARWRHNEAETGKPLTVILDQAEEYNTLLNGENASELDNFLGILAVLFKEPSSRPHGRLILSFRKEWLAEIDDGMKSHHLPCAKVFLKPLDRRGIIEAATGPARSERLHQHFSLRIEDGLAAEIAADLLADPSSAVAPTLQILLSKLWDQAKARDYDHPHFDRTLYHDLRRKGLLLGDFLDQQLAALRTQQPAAVDSGLALDLLAFHTTPLGTAEQRTLAELRDTYAHQSMTIDSLLIACRALYLLVDPAENRPDAKHEITRLAHDTLAPLVRHRFEESDAPGQRARRILESRAVDWGEGKAGTPLDEADLAIVETGKPGMRGWQPDEERLIQASYSVHAQRQAERERIQQERTEAKQREQAEREARAAADARADQEQKNAGKLRRRAVLAAMAAALALVLFMIAIYLFNNARIARDDEAVARATAEMNELAAIHAQATAEINEDQARVAEATAVVAKAEAEAAKAEVERLTRAIRADQLTGKALNVVDESPPLALLLAAEGMRAQHDFTTTIVLARPVTPDNPDPITRTAIVAERLVGSAQTNIHELLGLIGGQPLAGHENGVASLVFSPDGRWLATASVDNTARLWDVASADPGANPIVLAGHEDFVLLVAFSPDGRWLATASQDNTARLWDVASADPSADPIVLAGDDAGITSVAFSPDGRWLATASFDNTMRLWDVTAADPGADPIMLTGHEDVITSVAFSPDGRWLATGSVDNTARLWDVTEPDLSAESIVLAGHEDVVEAVTFSPDGQWLVTASQDNTARLWGVTAADPSANQIVLAGHKDVVEAVAFSPDGRWLATASFDKTTRLWDMTAADLGDTPIILSGHKDQVWSAAFSPDGRWLATASEDKTARLWDVTLADPGSGSIVLAGHEGSVGTVAFSPDGRWLATGGADITVRLWNVTAADFSAEPIVLAGHEGSVWDVAFSPNGRWLVTASVDNPARLWNVASADPGADPIVLAGHEDVISSVAFSPDGRWLATASRDNTTQLWDMTSADPGADPIVLAGYEDDITSVAFSPDGRWLATASRDNTTRLWDVTAADPSEKQIVLASNSDRLVAFSPDGRWLATGDAGVAVRLWDMTAADPNGGPIVLDMDEDDAVGGQGSMAFSPDGRWLAIESHDFMDVRVQLWNVTTAGTGATPIVLSGNRKTWFVSMAFSPDGQWLATASMDNTVWLWNMTAADIGADPIILTGHDGSVASVAFSPDGRWLATASSDNTARLWDVASANLGADPIILAGHDGSVASVAFSPDGRWLATASSDNTARLWTWQVDDLLAVVCRFAGRNLDAEEWERHFQDMKYRRTCPQWPAPLSVTQSLRAEAIDLARQGEIASAVAAFEEALALDPDLSIAQEELITFGGTLLNTGVYTAGMATLAKAQVISPTFDITATLPADNWNNACWNGALAGEAATILPACERAVAVAPEHGGYRDSRGLARALTGNVPGAIADFRFFVEWARTTGRGRNVDWREAWIARLEAGESPAAVFDAETVEQLRNE